MSHIVVPTKSKSSDTLKVMKRIADLKSSQYAAKKARFQQQKLSTKESNIISECNSGLLPHFSCDEIKIGKLLGTGGFNNVYEISDVKIHQKNIYTCEDDEYIYDNKKNEEEANVVMKKIRSENRRFIQEHCKRDNESRYAMKFLRPRSMADPKVFAIGAVDLVTESKFLASLNHPNIIKIRGLSKGGVKGFESGVEGGYFLIIDRLHETLDDRIKRKWQLSDATAAVAGSDEIKCNNSPIGAIDIFHTPTTITRRRRRRRRIQIQNRWSKKMKIKKYDNTKSTKEDEGKVYTDTTFTDRLSVAYDISSALLYLHDRNIIYRDLKPKNIGFDVRGDVKMFDFGLVKELPNTRRTFNDGKSVKNLNEENETYEMSGNAGSQRYMAPEVAKGQRYNLSADVYSFGIVLWEILSLEKSFQGMDQSKHYKCVTLKGFRPKCPSHWPSSIRSLIKCCWSQDLKKRPNMKKVHKELRDEIIRLRRGDDTGLECVKRRSTFKMNLDFFPDGCDCEKVKNMDENLCETDATEDES